MASLTPCLHGRYTNHSRAVPILVFAIDHYFPSSSNLYNACRSFHDSLVSRKSTLVRPGFFSHLISRFLSSARVPMVAGSFIFRYKRCGSLLLLESIQLSHSGALRRRKEEMPLQQWYGQSVPSAENPLITCPANKMWSLA